jgi:hypothetical protein
MTTQQAMDEFVGHLNAQTVQTTVKPSRTEHQAPLACDHQVHKMPAASVTYRHPKPQMTIQIYAVFASLSL